MTPRLKTGSKAERDQLRAEMLAADCTTAEIATEMRARFRMRPREAWRHAYGWTLQEAADRMDGVTAHHPGEAVAADASLVGKWEKWPGPSGRRPTLAVLGVLAETYGCPIEQLLDLEDRRALPDSDRRLLRHTAPAPAAYQSQPAAAPTQTEPVGADLIRVAADESAAWAAWAEASNVGDIALEQLMAEARALAVDYLTDDPAPLFVRTRKLRDRTFALLEGRQHPRQSADLYVAAGYLCGLLAWMSSDLGQLRDADTQGRTAWLCAELAGHVELRAWVLSTRSKVAFWDGRLRDAINHARRGAMYHPTGTVGILLACQEADAWSQLGAANEARTALIRASEARDNLAGTDDIGALFSCPEYRRANYATAVQLRVGDPASAIREAEEAITTQPFHSYGTTAQMHIAQACAHMELRSPDGAAEALRPVLALAPDHRLDTVTRRMQELAAAMARSRTADGAPAVALQGEIEAWCTDSAPRNNFVLSSGEGPG
ncbi:helix-turn-helix transcriptional regulator [Streptomyces sp. NPDC004647]|uniref:helix-turn-helix transcriptional regulator n=1 Tax=Streptomyces sp. NPDC004647 TaxID=3154671 RepID=UPI0033A0ED8F